MTDKEQPWFRLPDHALVALEGRDALAFSQAQFMSDVTSLADGQWHWSGWLTPKGRVIALFALLRRDAERIWLVLHDADPEGFVDALRRYVFRSKVAISARGELPIAGTFAPPTTGVFLDLGGDGGARTLRIGGDAAASDLDAVERWTTVDLSPGLPRLPPSQAEQWTPQQLSLERLRAFSVKKGCYPGQEIVARTHFLGQAKRGLALLGGDGTLSPGAEVRAGDRVLGTVVSSSGSVALAVLPVARDSDIPGVRELPLLGGLAR